MLRPRSVRHPRGDSPRTSIPATRRVSEPTRVDAGVSPSRAFAVSDLPAPDSPTSATHSPAPTSRSRSRTRGPRARRCAGRARARPRSCAALLGSRAQDATDHADADDGRRDGDPGNKATQGACCSSSCARPTASAPTRAWARWGRGPRKLSPAAARMLVPTPMVASTLTAPTTPAARAARAPRPPGHRRSARPRRVRPLPAIGSARAPGRTYTGTAARVTATATFAGPGPRTATTSRPRGTRGTPTARRPGAWPRHPPSAGRPPTATGDDADDQGQAGREQADPDRAAAP